MIEARVLDGLKHRLMAPELFREFAEEVVPNSTHIAHPRYLAYVMASPHGLAPFAEALCAMLNQGCSLWELSPVANAM